MPSLDEATDNRDGWVRFAIRDAALFAMARSLLLSSDIPFHVIAESNSKHVPEIVVPASCAADVELLLDGLKRDH